MTKHKGFALSRCLPDTLALPSTFKISPSFLSVSLLALPNSHSFNSIYYGAMNYFNFPAAHISTQLQIFQHCCKYFKKSVNISKQFKIFQQSWKYFTKNLQIFQNIWKYLAPKKQLVFTQSMVFLCQVLAVSASSLVWVRSSQIICIWSKPSDVASHRTLVFFGSDDMIFTTLNVLLFLNLSSEFLSIFWGCTKEKKRECSSILAFFGRQHRQLPREPPV